MVRHRLALGAVAVMCAVLVGGSARAQCEGDCDRNGAVAINELVAAVRIALGNGNVGECSAVDSNDSGTVEINELVAAVTRALGGCEGELDDVLRASARAAVEPIIRIIDLGSANAGAGGNAGLAALSAVARPAGVSGCQDSDCFLFGERTGSEQVCCLGTEYSISADSCIYNDDDGNVFRRQGFFSVTGDSIECTGAFPVGSDFEATFDNFLFVSVDTAGNFSSVFANLLESFEATAGGCSESQPDQFGFGIRGDGMRSLDGFLQEIAGDADTLVVNESTHLSLSIDVGSEPDTLGCRIDAVLNGQLTSADSIARSQFTAGLSDLALSQVPQGGAVALDINGTVSTDCVGGVGVETLEPLRLNQSSDCFSGGRLRAQLAEGTAIIGYTPNGGLELDFGGDGSIDERVDSCEDLSSEQCVGEENPNLCAPCDDSNPCSEELLCYLCTFNCQSDVQRCARADEYVACEDGVF